MKIIHIKQFHKISSNPTSLVLEAVAQSQFLVAQTIKAHATCPVVREGLYEDMVETNLLMSDVAKTIFPHGLPDDFDQLTSLQKEFLYEEGAAFTLFYLGNIPAVYKAIHQKVSEELDSKIAEGQNELIFEPREQEAMQCAKEAAIKKCGRIDNATVILVFGRDHNFQPYCKKENFL